MPKKATTPAPVVEDAEVDYTKYVGKAPTDLQERFAEWILDKTEYDPSSEKTKAAAFAEGVRLGVALRMPFQRSDENQAVLEERREANEAKTAAKPAKKATKKAKPAPDEDDIETADEALERPVRKAVKKAVKKAAAPVEVDDDDTEEAPAPKRTTRKAAKRGAGASGAEAAF